jgi:hypothetical protein
MKQIFVDENDERDLAEARARRNAQVDGLRDAEEKLATQKKLAYEAAFELPCDKWTPAHKEALNNDIGRVLSEWNGQHGG